MSRFLAVFLVTAIVLFCMLNPCWAQDKTFISVGGVGVATMDETAGNYNFGAGYFIAVNHQVSKNLVVGASYSANKIIGKADFDNINTQSATAVSRYFFKDIETSKFNIFLVTAGGWIGIADDNSTDNGISGLFGGGVTYDFYEGVNLVVEGNISSLGDDFTAFVINAGLSFPFP